MRYTMTCASPLGTITLGSDGDSLTELWFEGQKYDTRYLNEAHEENDLPVFEQTKLWLDIYFSGKSPDFTPPLRFTGSDFQNEVWNILTAIPHGQTRTYGDIAEELAQKRGCTRISPQAVGGAVGKNKISIIVPCHRVMGKSGSLTGYSGGIMKKIELLKLEGAWKENFFVPKHSTPSENSPP